MKNKTLLNIAGLNTAIYSVGSFWQPWKYKADQYTVKRLNKPLDLFVSLVQSDKKAEPQKLLRDEKSGFFSHRVYETENGYLYSYERIKSGEVILRYLASNAFDKITLLEDNSETNGDLAFEYLTQIIPSVMLAKNNALTFHGVLMEYEGRGIVISASSGTGKTTHARLWRDLKNALIINGDRALCKKSDGMWRGYGMPWSGTSGEQINRSAPLSALVVLERGEINKAERIEGLTAFAAVMPHIQYPTWDRALTEKMTELLDDFLRSVPIIRLTCRPDADAVETLYQCIMHYRRSASDGEFLR